MKSVLYWLDIVFIVDILDYILLLGCVDVVVIGGGFIGLFLVLVLVKCGVSVVICEVGVVGGEVFGCNGGQCNNGMVQDYVGLVVSYGEEKVQLFYQFYNQVVDLVEQIVKLYDIDCDFCCVGKIKLVVKFEYFEKLKCIYEVLVKVVDFDVKLLDVDVFWQEIVFN